MYQARPKTTSSATKLVLRVVCAVNLFIELASELVTSVPLPLLNLLPKPSHRLDKALLLAKESKNRARRR